MTSVRKRGKEEISGHGYSLSVRGALYRQLELSELRFPGLPAVEPGL